MDHQDYDIIIIGSGVTGMAAAIYCGRFGLKTAVFGESIGGTIILTDDISNYPGFKSISGIELAKKIMDHALDYKVDFIEKKVSEIQKCQEGCFKVFSNDIMYHTKIIIYATGTEWKKLNVPGEKEYTGKGVHYCALCDGPVYSNKIVGIIGGSDSAAKEALLMAQYASHVHVFVRGSELRAEPINQKRVEMNEKITIHTNVSVTEILGGAFMTSVKLNRSINGNEIFNVDGIFINIGHIPLVALAKNIGIELNDKNEIIIDRMSQTNIKGFYAAGDVTDTQFKQAITGVSEGVSAAYGAYHYLDDSHLICLHNDEQ